MPPLAGDEQKVFVGGVKPLLVSTQLVKAKVPVPCVELSPYWLEKVMKPGGTVGAVKSCAANQTVRVLAVVVVFWILTTLPNCCARVLDPGELELVERKLIFSPPELTLH